jgi:hypothetical protein
VGNGDLGYKCFPKVFQIFRLVNPDGKLSTYTNAYAKVPKERPPIEDYATVWKKIMEIVSDKHSPRRQLPIYNQM